MPTLASLQIRYPEATGIEAHLGADEEFVPDVRQGLRPTQALDRKFNAALHREQRVRQAALRPLQTAFR